MSEWKQKRFWTEVRVEQQGDGFAVLLDGRGVKTPAKTSLIVPSEALAQAIAKEWDAQDDKIVPETMPMTRSANAALDKVTPQFNEVASLLAAYGETDLLCYRAASPSELIERQAKAWDPILDWAAEKFEARLNIGQGVMYVEQDPHAIDALTKQVISMTPFELTGFHDLVGMSGSLVLALSVIHGVTAVGDAWELSRLDETWQIEQWGNDEEASKISAQKCISFEHAYAFYKAVC